MRIDLYSQSRHRLVIDSQPVDGFDEGDWLLIKVDGGAVTRTPGCYGPVLNRTPVAGGQITLSLLPTSPALGEMIFLRESMLVQPDLFSISLVNGVEEVFSAKGCGFGDIPQFATGSDKMKGRQFVFECSLINLDDSGVKPISAGLFGGLLNI